MEIQEKSNVSKLIPVMLAFFAMGFVDLVGTASNYVQKDLGLSDSTANVFPGMVFFWFLIFSVPTGLLMSRIGRRKTVVLSLVVTAASLLIPIFVYDYTSMLVSFALLGIGNTLMQVSLNPLLSNIVKGEKLASSLTTGQFVKAIASFIAPILMARFALAFDNWRMMFPLFAVIGIIAAVWLGMTHIDEKLEEKKTATFKDCFSLLGKSFIFLCFLGIVCHVGIDVGVNTTAPKILMERLHLPLEDAGYATVIYFIFRTIGCFSGAFLLARFSAKNIFVISIVLMAIGIGGLFIAPGLSAIYTCIALVGLGNSNVFPIIFSQALLHLPHKKDEVSGLMIMGLFGGTIFPLLMGFLADVLASQIGALIILSVGVVYLMFMSSQLKKN
ncbi:MAG: MFS transporter [Dysgonamonadaceae bacterium]